ncbi:flagellar filament capping protein FliD [Frigoribacterium endophyticum]|uniref:flagellar filament capping protein FliD n=1 Tax=Frigoribacterium endophyticum TaxID=1522176 RepID=UPI0014237859|nr:flagellar filament capping protein FliD [Frigoribacterium endophyticum]NII51938.1 flagellar hook-associated protein 2 [Frigoribacterium endophyticum]
MANLGIDGLASGLDTTSLINSLMSIEATPQTLLKNKVTAANSFVTSMQTLNAQVAALATTATTAAKPGSIDLFTATSSSTAVTAKAAAGAASGSIEFTVGATAQAKTAVTAAMTAWPTSPATLTFTSSAGKQTEVTAASSSLDDVVKAVNDSAAGVKAVKVPVGKDASGAAVYRLQLTSATSGATGDFAVHRGTAAETTAGTAPDLLAEPGAAVVKTARDASLTLYAGTAAEQVVTSASNTFTDLLPGVSVDVTAAAVGAAAPVTIMIGRDATAAGKVASGLVSSLTAVLGAITAGQATTSTTGATGNTTVKGGAYTGESSVRAVQQALQSAASQPIGGKSPSTIGVVIQKDGSFSYDADKFSAALAADPVGTQSMLSTLADRIAKAASSASDKASGTLTTVITGQQSVVKDLGGRIADWDLRLATRRATLQTVYSNLEVTLSNLNSQSTWLSSQVASLTAQTK